GRYAVTQKEDDKGKFRTPPLRDVSKRAPFMHDGSVANLTEVVKLYVKGGIPNPNLDRKVDQRYAEILDLNERQIKQLVAFMESLDGEGYQDVAPTAFPK
ncbi:MAG: cytochrome-c peroxidase, partial [Rubripirellula sp.]